MENKATICLSVAWPEAVPPKPEIELQKAVQTWLTRFLSNAECLRVTAQRDGTFSVEVSSASAQDLFAQETKLTLKNWGTALVTRVLPRDGQPEDLSSSLQTPYPPNPPPVPAPPVAVSCTVPLVHFWYVNQVYREKMKRIEKENGVHIMTDVSVSFNIDPSGGGDPVKALSEFTDLVQSCLGDSNCFSYSHELGQVDWEKALQFIQRDQDKLTLTVSPHEVEVCGPMQSLKTFENISKMRKKTLNTQIPGPSSAREAQGRSHRVNMNFRDPLLSSGVEMDPASAQVMTIGHKDEIAKIESKFGVTFYYFQDTVKARAKPEMSDDAVTLESHALRAFLCVYQRVATSVLSCSLLSQSQRHAVEERLTGLPGVVPNLHGDQWRIIGLPENLRQAVAQVEGDVGRPVFKEEDKQRIGHLRYGVDSSGGSDLNVLNLLNHSQAVAQVEGDMGRPVFKEEDKQRIGCSKAVVDEVEGTNGPCVIA
ncbi:unnamed protein product [Lota lota]